MQEIEMKNNIDKDVLTFPGFELEIEKSSWISRVGIFIKTGINYARRYELEGADSHLIVIDVNGIKVTRIINKSLNSNSSLLLRGWRKLYLMFF